MISNPIVTEVKIRHSPTGKLDVVKGAISERLVLEETFVREFKTLKSYGTLVTLVYNDKVASIFPDPQSHGALSFEKDHDGIRLKVVEWALPKVSNPQIENQNSADFIEISEDYHPKRSSLRYRQRWPQASHMEVY